jgi:hypothetical protein
VEDEQPKRVSQRPSSIPAAVPRPYDVVLRLAFAAAWIAAQITLVVTADRRPDGAFGFRMFSESSTLVLALSRELGDGTRLHVDGGTWIARDAGGMTRRFSWFERVKNPRMTVFDAEIAASYGAAAQLSRLQLALDDVAAHIPEDAETKRLLLDVTVRKNGREPYVVHLASAPRGGP